MNWKPPFATLAILSVPVFPTVAYAEQDEPSIEVAEQLDEPATHSDTDPIAGFDVATANIATTDTPMSSARVHISEDQLTDDDLLQLRGGQAIVVGNQTLTAISNGNAFNGNYAAGNISLTDNALSNFNGLGNLLINTGAQNNLQSAMNVTINFAQ
jgi:hypothetical protein